MRRWKFGALAALGVALVLAGLIVFVLPGIVKRQTVQRVEAATGRTLAIGGISLNPFTWTVDVRDFRFSERGVDETFAAFASARIAVSPSSLFRWAPIIAEARVAAPYLRVIRTGKDAYNFSDLLRWLPRHHRLVLHDLTVTDGAIDVIDQALPVETRHELREIALTVPFVTTVASLGDRYITPHIRAVVNGSPLQAEGRLRPLPRIAEASFDVDLKGLVLPFYRAYLPEDFPVQVEEGQASAEVAVSYRAAPNEAPDLTLEGVVTLAGVKLADRTGEPFLAVKGVEVGIVRARPLAGEFALSLVAADGLEVFLWRDAAGVWSHSRFVEGASPRAVPRRKALVTVAETRLRHGRFHFADHFPPGGFTADLQEVSLDLRGYSTAPGKRGTYTLSFATPRGETGTLKGEFSPVPLATSSSIELTGAALETYSPYLASILRAEVKGGVDVAAQLDFGRPEGWKLDHVAARVRELSVPFGTTEGLRLASLAFDGGRFRQKENLLEVDEVTLADGDLRFSRNRKGTLSPSALLRPGATGPPRGKGEPAKPPLRYRIGRVSGSGINVAFADGLREKQPSFALRNVAFTLEQLSGPAVGPIPFRVDGAYGKDGSLRASGSFTPTRRELKGELALQRIPLADFNAYLPENLQMVVANGVIDAGLFVSLTATGNRLTGTFGGSAGVRSLHCLDAEGRDLLSWDALQLDQVKGSLAPFAIEIEDVALSRFDSRIVVQEDGTLNLQHLYPATPEGRWTPQPPARGKGKTVRIGTVTLQDGTVAFTDHHVAGGYTTTIYQLGGRISSLSSAEDRFADVDLRGNLENQSPLRITGQVNPLRDDLFADLKVSFSDIDLSPMTPYAGTYLGYAVDTGQLFLDAQYRIENRKLDSENRVFIDQLTLGKRIDSGRATDLPVRLAVALLKNRKGEIRLDLPVAGRLDDPQFNAWDVLAQIFKNFFVQAETAPLTLLQSMFGWEEDIESVGFAYGSAELSPGEREKLRKLATALDDRPALKIEILGFVDPERDPEGYRNELLRKKVRAEKVLGPVTEELAQRGSSPDTVQLTPEEEASYLKAVYAKEAFPKPREASGLVKELPEAEMKKLILANTLVGEQELRSLAEARAAAVRAFLVEQGEIDPARVVQKSGDIYKGPPKEGTSGSRVEFEVAVE